MDNSPLASLPGELRNRIYELVLRRDEEILLVHRGKHDQAKQRQRAFLTTSKHVQNDYKNLLALTQTCAEIRRETHTLFFALNSFRISSAVLAPLRHGQVLYQKYLGTCRDWLLEIEQRDAKVDRQIVIEGPHLHLASKDVADKILRWFDCIQELKQDLAQTAIDLSRVSTVLKYDYLNNAALLDDAALYSCGYTKDADIGRVVLEFDFANLGKLAEHVKSDIAKKREMLDSHRQHHCGMRGTAPHLRYGLEDVEYWIVSGLQERH